MFNVCDDLKCKANDGNGFCRISICSLIDPQKAIEELKTLENKGDHLIV